MINSDDIESLDIGIKYGVAVIDYKADVPEMVDVSKNDRLLILEKLDNHYRVGYFTFLHILKRTLYLKVSILIHFSRFITQISSSGYL